MDHRLDASDHAAHNALINAAKYLPVIAIIVTVIYEASLGHFVLLGMAAALALMFMYRLGGITAPMTGSEPHVSMDGGSLSAKAARAEREAQAKATVVDGGSMERSHR